MSANRVYFIHALTPIHSGTGQGTGVIDLPIAREIATKLPIIPGSSLKGVLRADRFEEMKNGGNNTQKDELEAIFGPATADADAHSGSLTLSDARLLCLPVRSLSGTFAWITSPLFLMRFQRDLGKDKESSLAIKIADEDIVITTGSELTNQNYRDRNQNKLVYLEDLDLTVDATQSESADTWADRIAKSAFPGENNPWAKCFKERFAIVNDDVFAFLYETGTEVCTRIKIDDEKKTTVRGALWLEEALPAESVLWGMALAEKSYKKGVNLSPTDMLDTIFPKDSELITQVGGNATVGRGRIRITAMNGEVKG